MSRCDYEGVFYKVFCVGLLIIAFTFTVILTNVFIDIDNLLNKKERGSEVNLVTTEVTTDENEATTEIQDYYIGLERNAGHYRSKRSLDSEQVLLRIASPKTKKYLTNRLAALLEALDDDESENTTPKTDNGNIYIKTVKQKNNIEINELPHVHRDQMKSNEDVVHFALDKILQGAMGHLDMPELLNKVQSLVSNLKDREETRSAGSVEQNEFLTENKNNLSEEPTPETTERFFKYSTGKKRDITLNCNDVTDTIHANLMRKKKLIHGKNKNSKPVIRTVIDIKKDDENSMDDYQGIIKLIYNGKPIKIRTEGDSYETSTAVATTTRSVKLKTTTNSLNKDVEDFAGAMREKFRNKHLPDAYIKSVMLEYLKNFASNDSLTSTTIVEKKKIRIKRNPDWSHEKQTEIPQTKDDDELFVEIETHFDKTGVKGEKKRKLVSSLIKKIQNAIRSCPDDKGQTAPIKKRVQNRLDHGTVPVHINTPPVSPSYRELDPISKSMPLAAPLPLVSDKNGETWKKPYQQPKFLSTSKSINSAEMNQLIVDYNQVPNYPVIPKRQQLPLSVDTSGENMNNLDVGKLQLLIKDIEGTGFSIGYNQYLDQAPDPESIKLFHGIENIVNKYHEKHDIPDQPGNHEDEYEMYGQEMKKREVKSETSLRTKRFIVNRNNDFIATVSKRKGKPLVVNAYRKKRAVNLKTIINSNKRIRVNKYINTNAFSRHGRYFKTNKRSKRQIDNIKVIDKIGQTSEDNNMFVVSDGDTYNDNLLVRHRQKPEIFFVDIVKPGKEHFLNHKPFFQPSNKPFSPHTFEIKNLNIYKNTPMFFENTREKIIKLQEKKERNKRHTLKIYTRDMGHRDSSERSFATEYDENNEDTFADRTVITHVDGPQLSTSDEEVRKVEIGHSRYNDVPIIYRNPFIVEKNEHTGYENKNPAIFDNDQHEFNFDPIRDQIRRNPLMSKYPHVFVEERTSEEEPEFKHIHRSIYPMPENKETDTSSDIERLYQAPNVQDLVNAIAPSYRNNYKISVKLLPRDTGGNNTGENFKVIHTSINKTVNKDGLLYSSLVNISEISKVDNYTNKCNHHLESITPKNIAKHMKPVQIRRGFENIFMANKLAEYQRNILTNTTQGPIKATTEDTMHMNLMDIILPSSPRRVLHLTLADVGKLICDSMKSQNTNKLMTNPQIEQTRTYIPETTTTPATTTTTAMPTTMMTTEAVATTILEPEKRIATSRKSPARNTQSVDPLKIKLLKAISMNEQLTSQILDRIDQNTGILRTFLSKIANKIEKLPNIANQEIKNNERIDINNWNEFKKKPDEYPNFPKAHTINVTKIAAYSLPEKPPNIKPATLYNLNYVQTLLEKNPRIIQANTSDELKPMEHMKYFIDYDPKSTVSQSVVVDNGPQRLVQDSLVNNGINKLNAGHIPKINIEPSQILNNMHSMMPAINNVIAQNNGTRYLL